MPGSDEDRLLRSHRGPLSDAESSFLIDAKPATEEEDGDLENRGSDSPIRGGGGRNKGFRDLLSKFRHLDRGFSGGGHRQSRNIRHSSPERDRDRLRDEEMEIVDSNSRFHRSHSLPDSPSALDDPHNPLRRARRGDEDTLAESAPPEWALLLIGCLLGLATGLCVAAFNRGVHLIHEWAWAGTPEEGAAWLRLQSLADTWHRILLIPVTGGVIVGMMHGLVEILDQIRPSSSSERQGFDVLSSVFPTIKAIQAAVTLGTGCSLGPEGPSVDIGKAWAHGCSIVMENNRERKIALVAAGAAAGIASGFNAAVAGCFFAIETVLRPLRAENSPPFTTAMIILASVISSTVSNELLGDKSAFTVPAYELKSAAGYGIMRSSHDTTSRNSFSVALLVLCLSGSSAIQSSSLFHLWKDWRKLDLRASFIYFCNFLREVTFFIIIFMFVLTPGGEVYLQKELPLYLILGMLCGVVSVIFSRLVIWFTKFFEFIKDKFGLPAVVCPALGGLGAGIVALKYPGILYWGFTNVDEILHTGKSASAPGIWLLAQLAAAKVVATALCKGSGLVGGLYAPSLMIGAAVGAVFGGSAAELINSAVPGNDAVAQPQAYALVGMAATLASVCSVPLTSVLLLFELTKDYRILLPLMGAVGLAIWVPSIANQGSKAATHTKDSTKGYSVVPPQEAGVAINGEGDDNNHLELSVIGNAACHGPTGEDILLEDLKVSHAMSMNFTKACLTMTLKEAMKLMHERRHSFILVVDNEGLLEGILTHGDIKRFLSKKASEVPSSASTVQDVYAWPISRVCTLGINFHGRERGVLTCYPDTDLATAKDLIEAKDIKQLPVVKRGGDLQKERRRRIVAVLSYDSILDRCREEINRHGSILPERREESIEVAARGH